MLAIGAGGLDVALAHGRKTLYLICPKVIKINLTGKLQPMGFRQGLFSKYWKSLLRKETSNTVFEYGGEGAASLSVPERATITNWARNAVG